MARNQDHRVLLHSKFPNHTLPDIAATGSDSR